MPFAIVQSPILFAAEGATLALWLPAGMMLAGAAMLGLLVYLSMRDRREARKALPPTGYSADELDRLKRAADRAALLTAAAEKAADALDERIADLEQLLERADAVLDQNQTATRDASLPVRQATGVDIEPKRAPQSVNLDPLSLAVYELADAGRTPVEIAGELKEHTGKVELILNLRRSGSADERR